MKSRKFFCYLGIVVLLIAGVVFYKGDLFEDSKTSVAQTEPILNDVTIDAKHMARLTDEEGIPYVQTRQGRKLVFPTAVALYTLEYGGFEKYYNDVEISPSEEKYQHGIQWLEQHAEYNEAGYVVWKNPYPVEYKGLEQESGWYSSLTQSTGIDALISAWRKTEDPRYLALAEKAAAVFFVEISKGGVKYEDKKNEYIWFEEFWGKEEATSHALGAHLRVLHTLNSLYEATHDEKYYNLLNNGMRSLSYRMPLYDTGSSLIHDLRVGGKNVKFSLVNEYTHQVKPLAVESISLRSPANDFADTLRIGDNGKGMYIQLVQAGWQKPELHDSRKIRRLAAENQEGNFFISIPAYHNIDNNQELLELTFGYKDEQRDNLSLRIGNQEDPRELLNSEILLTGSNEWRKWIVALRWQEFGEKVNNAEYKKYLEYFEPLIQLEQGYHNKKLLNRMKEYAHRESDAVTIVPSLVKPMPKQVFAKGFSFDSNGVIMQNMVTEDSAKIAAVYGVYNVAKQAMNGKNLKEGTLFEQLDSRKGYDWLGKSKTAIGDSYVWRNEFCNVYNDVEQKEAWASSFSQKYVIDAFVQQGNWEMVQKAINAYKYTTDEGGLMFKIRADECWFEEVPNNTHILNAHIASLVTLKNEHTIPEAEALFRKGVTALKNNLYLYDTGYWTRYDANPKKMVLLQFDLLSGNRSPEIDAIMLENLATQEATFIDLGEENDDKEGSRISGIEWGGRGCIDGKSVRYFSNGYRTHAQDVPGGTRQNSYVWMSLPRQEFEDYFEVPLHKLMIRYKDVTKGKMVIKVQAINEGKKLAFVPLKNAIIECKGDNQWKEASIMLRPQELGWFMGRDYQAYHYKMLKQLGEQANDWYIQQYAERCQYYLESSDNAESVIVFPDYVEEDQERTASDIIKRIMKLFKKTIKNATAFN